MAAPIRRRSWRVRQPDPGHVATLTRALGLSNVVAGLLVNRGHLEPAQAEAFLDARLTRLESPRHMLGMDAAVAAVLAAFDSGKRVTIYGDYDVDGMTAASVLTRFFRAMGWEPQVFLPDRFVDGYGLNPDRVRELAEAGTRLFISVDCGVTAVGAIGIARSLGAEFVVVDHHQPPDGPLPDATAILNPHQAGCAFPFKDMCAAGLAFYLVLGLRAALRERGAFVDRAEPDVRELLDIVAIGTIADVVPLTGLNRVLVTAGMARMERSPHAGVRALTALTSKGGRLTAKTVGYQIGPRLNAAGRLSHPMKGFELLTTDDPEVARRIGDDLEEENKSRQDLQKSIEVEAIALAELDGHDAPAYVLWKDGWHPGVSGIVAARILERYHRPCAMIALVDGVGKGSIRSIRGFDAVAGLRLCAETLDQFGGHPFAAGLTVQVDRLNDFKAAFQAAAKLLTAPEHLIAELRLDAEVGFDAIDDRLVTDLDHLSPFGAGNPEPLLCTMGARVMDARRVGDGSHLKLTLAEGGLKFGAIAFGMGERAPEQGALIDVAFRPEVNQYRGGVSLQLRVVDFRPHEAGS